MVGSRRAHQKGQRQYESHSIATLSWMFFALAQKVKDAECNEDDGVHQNSILDNLPLAQEHLVFKFS